MQTLCQDLRYAARMLTKSPGFLAVAVLTLAMAIGANAVVFSVLNALILHPLHVPNADTLWAIQHGNEDSLYEPYPDYLDLRDRNRSFEGLAVFSIDEAAVDTGDNASRIWLAELSGNYFDLLGVQPYLGRVFHPSDERGPNSAVLPFIVPHLQSSEVRAQSVAHQGGSVSTPLCRATQPNGSESDVYPDFSASDNESLVQRRFAKFVPNSRLRSADDIDRLSRDR